MKKPILIAIAALILISFLAFGESQNTEFSYNLSDKNEPLFKIKPYDDWNELRVRYGLITSDNQTVYSSDLNHTFNLSIENGSMEDYDGSIKPALKFSIGTKMPANYSGFFYEFLVNNPETETLLYYDEYQTFFNPGKYHIRLTDLFQNYDNIEISGNKVIIYVDGDEGYYDFDPGLFGNGIPTNCIMNFYSNYNVTTVDKNDLLNMSLKFNYDGLCSSFSLGWEDNSSGSWATIPSTTYDLSCNGATCTHTSPSKNVWYSKFPKCIASDYYWTKGQLRYDDEDSASHTIYSTPQKISCNETDEYDARDIIFEAIYDSLDDYDYSIDQQLYAVNQSGYQSKGFFDIVAIKSNQTWAFNYITGSDTEVGMPSIPPALNVLEMNEMPSPAIYTTTYNFITSTLT